MAIKVQGEPTIIINMYEDASINVIMQIVDDETGEIEEKTNINCIDPDSALGLLASTTGLYKAVQIVYKIFN